MSSKAATFSLDNASYKLDPVFLRDACSCPLCVDTSTLQRHFKTSSIPPDINIKSCETKDGAIHIRWNNDIPNFTANGVEHVSTFSKRNLEELFFPERASRVGRPQTDWDKAEMEKKVHWVSYKDYMESSEAFQETMAKLYEDGLVFLKDVPEDRKSVERIATHFGPLRNSLYGLSWDVKSIAKAQNVAYTNQDLGFHMDLLYMADPPAYQLLHCLHNSCEGGESLFVDTYRVVREMASNPETTHHLDVMKSYPVSYHYKNGGTYYQHEHPLVEFEESPLEPGDEIDPHTTTRIRHVNWSPPFQGPFQDPNLKSRNAQQHPTAAALSSANLRRYLAAAAHFNSELNSEKNIFQLKMRPGECVIFANRRVAHARRAFDTSGGQRWLAGAYVDEDAFLSTCLAPRLAAMGK